MTARARGTVEVFFEFCFRDGWMEWLVHWFGIRSESKVTTDFGDFTALG
jgi:hypothetical protein